MGIRSPHCCIKNLGVLEMFQNAEPVKPFGMAFQTIAGLLNSHLATLKSNTHDIIHEGIPLDNFESDFMKEPSFSWNPPIRNTLMAVGKNNIDDQLDFNDFETLSQNDNDDSSSGVTDSHSDDVTMTPVEEFLQVDGDSSQT